MESEKIKFIDLFAGIGGFHFAMKKMNGECVFSSEINKAAINTYKKNHNIDADHDITKVAAEDIPSFDFLCAGFPCQTFSKAGSRLGFKDETKGTLFFEILRVLEYHKPKYILLENVKNLVSHDEGNTWRVIVAALKNQGYQLPEKPLLLSPHQFGIPQLRERVFIPGIYNPENVETPLDLDFGELLSKDDNCVKTILDDPKVDNSSFSISKKEEEILEIWDQFYKGIKKTSLGFPVWADIFIDKNKFEEGIDIPVWKKNIIDKNVKLYEDNKKYIDVWLKKHNNLVDLHKGFRKFEWQAGDSISSIYEGLIQFRPSGVRVKRPNVAPALVAMVQIPIYGPLKRRLSLRECARLQSFPNNFIFDENQKEAYKQFGNSVNVIVVENVLKQLFIPSKTLVEN